MNNACAAGGHPGGVSLSKKSSNSWAFSNLDGIMKEGEERYQVIQQHMEYGILPGDTIQKMPRKIFFNYKENSEDEKEP